MKKHHIVTGLFLAAIAVVTLAAQDAARPLADQAVVVGTFDSRGVAIAYVRSDAFNTMLAEKRTELEDARAAGDDDRVREIEAAMPALQKRVHRQGFSTASIDDIMTHIADHLPAIAEDTGVDMIVSKWEIEYADDDARFVDVTSQIAALFDPDAETQEVIRQVLEQQPVPLDEIE